DKASDQALLVEPGDVTRCWGGLLDGGSRFGSRAGLCGHHPLLSGWRTDPFDGWTDYTAGAGFKTRRYIAAATRGSGRLAAPHREAEAVDPDAIARCSRHDRHPRLEGRAAARGNGANERDPLREDLARSVDRRRVHVDVDHVDRPVVENPSRDLDVRRSGLVDAVGDAQVRRRLRRDRTRTHGERDCG